MSNPALLTDDEIDTAALRNLPQSVKHGSSALSFELGYGNVDDLNAQRDAILEYRKRVSVITDGRTRRAYEKWLDFFQGQNDEARREMESGERRRSRLLYQSKRRSEEARISQCQQEIEKP